MSIITNITRMWLTRTIKPFTFNNEYDEILNYDNCENLGLYVHIPFCTSICNFCPYCKTLYLKERCNNYIDSLLDEINLVGSMSKNKKTVTSLYFGGGTPVLAIRRLKEIITVIKKYFIITDGIGIELHPNNVNVKILKILKNAGVTKISIGIQSFQKKYQDILGRKRINIHALSNALNKIKFQTVSMDFIFALPNQQYDDLKNDIEIAFSHGANHIAIYPFIDFTFTSSKVSAVKKRKKRKLLDKITNYCLNMGYSRNSIWTFSTEKGVDYSSMTRDNFIGFGCSAATLLNDSFKINTFSVDAYCDRVKNNKIPTSLTIRFTERQRMIYYLFWAFYSTKVDSRDFESFFGVPLNKMYGNELKLANLLGLVKEEKGVYTLTLKGAFYYHYYENFYTLSYIDKMWSIMRKEDFPSKIKLK